MNLLWCLDIQHNDTLLKDTLHKDTHKHTHQNNKIVTNTAYSMKDTPQNNIQHTTTRLSVAMLSVVMLSAVMLSVIMLSVVMLSVVMLNVLAPLLQPYEKTLWKE